MGATTTNLQTIKNKHADQPDKIICDTLPDPRVASVEPSWVEITCFEKCTWYVCARCLRHVTERIV